MAPRRARSRSSGRSAVTVSVPFFPPSVVLAQSAKEQRYLQELARAQERIDLTERVKELRFYAHGFDSDRYNLNAIDRWTEKKKQHVIESSKRLRYLTSRQHVAVSVPRNKDRQRALKTLLHQEPRELKRFIVHTEAPEKTTVEFSKNNKRARIRIQSGPKTSYVREFFLWNDFTKRPPVTLKAMRRVLKKMLPLLPEGRYSFLSEVHGMIGTPQSKEFLLPMLNDWYHAYEPPSSQAYLHQGFGRVLTGIVYLGTWQHMRAYQTRQARERQQIRQDNRFLVQQRRSKARQLARSAVKRCPARNRKHERCVLTTGHRGRHRYKGRS